MEYKIKPVSPTCIQLWSWSKGKKSDAYFHGEFVDMAELVQSLVLRKQTLGIEPELGEWSAI